MRYTTVNLNGHEFAMPAITVGSVRFGSKVTEEEAFSILDTYYAAGGNWLDTARVYCVELLAPEDRKPHFLDSEAVLGRWIKSRNVRDKITVSTKGAHWDLDTKERRVKPDFIRSDIALSLEKLGMNSVDIYFLHNDDPTIPVEVIMPVMHELVESGKTKAIGCSNWKINRIREANAFAENNGLTPFSIGQAKWSYAAPTDEMPAGSVSMEESPEEYAGYKELAMPFMAHSSQARGFFIKASKFGFSEESLGRAAAFLSPKNNRRAEIVQQIAKQENISVSAAAFAYLWSRDIPVTALVGPYSAEHLKDSLIDCDYHPTAAVKALLEEM